MLNFAWRAAANCLPTPERLCSRGADVDAICPCCGKEPETNLHVFFYCEKVREVWTRSGLGVSTPLSNIFSLWMQVIIINNNSVYIENFFMLLWSIWQTKNAHVWNDQSILPTSTIHTAQSMLYGWQQACIHANQESHHMSHASQQDHAISVPIYDRTKWAAPTPSFLKLNSDAALFHHEQRTGFGFILRDSTNCVIKCSSWTMQGVLDPTVAEALGIREALSWLKANNFSQVEFETDCQLLVFALQQVIQPSTSLGLVVSDCLNLIRELSSISIVFIPRSTNLIAHQLARALSS